MTRSLRHLMFIAFHYPPEASSSGVLRTLKFTQYLEHFGWRSTVIAPDETAYDVTDATLVAQIPATTAVVRTPFLHAKRHFAVRGKYPSVLAVPDAWRLWQPWAVAAARRTLARDPADALMSTSPHATAHLIAARIARRFRLPWIADFRDPWVEEPPEPDTPALVHHFSKRLERRVVQRADRVVATTRHLAAELAKRYAAEPDDKFVCLPNGFDESDFNTPRAASRTDGRLRFVHTGGINGRFRDPRPVIRALAALVRDGAVGREELELRFVGGGEYTDSAELLTCLQETQLLEVTRRLPRVSYAEALGEIAEADVALLLQASADTVGLVPAKLYEYLRAGKPVLALTPTGAAAAEVIAETRAGWVVDPSDVAAVKSTLNGIVTAWRAGRIVDYSAPPDRIRAYDRGIITRNLAAMLDRLTTERSQR